MDSITCFDTFTYLGLQETLDLASDRGLFVQCWDMSEITEEFDYKGTPVFYAQKAFPTIHITRTSCRIDLPDAVWDGMTGTANGVMVSLTDSGLPITWHYFGRSTVTGGRFTVTWGSEGVFDLGQVWQFDKLLRQHNRISSLDLEERFAERGKRLAVSYQELQGL